MVIVWGFSSIFSFSFVARWAVKTVTFWEMTYDKFVYVTHFPRKTEEKMIFTVNTGKFPAKVKMRS